MAAPHQLPEHAYGVLGVAWLAEHVIADHDDRVCTEHRAVRVRKGSCGGERLLPGESQRELFRGLAGRALFGDVGSPHGEADARSFEQLTPAWRAAGEYERRRRVGHGSGVTP